MSVIYEALKKAEREERELKQGEPRDWCPEFLSIGKGPKLADRLWYGGHRRLILLSLAVCFTLAFGLYPHVKGMIIPSDSLRKEKTSEKDDLERLKQEGETHYRNGAMGEAIRLWEPLVATLPADSMLLKRLGIACKKIGQLDKAILYDQKALEVNPNDAEAMNNLAAVYIEQNRDAEAKSLLEAAGEKDPNYPDPYFHLGRLYEKAGNLEEAIRAYQTFLARSPDPKSSVYMGIEARISQLKALP